MNLKKFLILLKLQSIQEGKYRRLLINLRIQKKKKKPQILKRKNVDIIKNRQLKNRKKQKKMERTFTIFISRQQGKISSFILFATISSSITIKISLNIHSKQKLKSLKLTIKLQIRMIINLRSINISIIFQMEHHLDLLRLR